MIPFARYIPTDQLVDVAEVQRGRECNCICPSCSVPLIARKGDSGERAHHFAHDTKAGVAPIQACELSFHVIARMMLLQTLNELDNYVIDTPGMVIDEWAEDTHGRVKGFHATVTTPRSITLEEVCASHDGPNKGFDLVGVVAGNLLNISLEHPQRPSQNVHIDPKHAVLLIDITALSMAMADNKRAFLEIMLDYVACHAPRRWISHPRMAQAKQKLARDIAAWKQTSRQDPAPARESRPSSPVDWSMVPAEHDAYCLRCRVSMGKVSRWCPTCFMPVSKRPG